MFIIFGCVRHFGNPTNPKNAKKEIRTLLQILRLPIIGILSHSQLTNLHSTGAYFILGKSPNCLNHKSAYLRGHLRF